MNTTPDQSALAALSRLTVRQIAAVLRETLHPQDLDELAWMLSEDARRRDWDRMEGRVRARELARGEA